MPQLLTRILTVALLLLCATAFDQASMGSATHEAATHISTQHADVEPLPAAGYPSDTNAPASARHAGAGHPHHGRHPCAESATVLQPTWTAAEPALALVGPCHPPVGVTDPRRDNTPGLADSRSLLLVTCVSRI
ncbi:hypothetical protein Aca07nite_71250 [Actinoplanes capillaceus]|uniref:Secreted protein n=1 Tax=Actinoplanes campanulatus TaxID=113559 RepID=A0ABQ3WUB8_9ACTN|nr:hypothetical protein Aca07nite_71250 [Actinoplanes capillaceus]